MPRPSINDIRSLGDFKTTYQWEILFLNESSDLQTALNLRCTSTDIPKASIQSIEVNIRGHKVKQPGPVDKVNTMTLAFVETVDNTIMNFITTWRNECTDLTTGAHGSMLVVKKDIQLVELDRQDNPIYLYNLEGCYLEDYDHGSQLQSDSGDVFRPTITLSFDHFTDGPSGT